MPTATWKSRLRSGSAHCDLEVAVGKSRLRSGSAHWDLELAVEVRQCPLGSGARGGGPAVPTGIWTARRRTRRRWRRRRRRRRTALIKSNNPHLAGGEKTFDSRLTKNCAETHLLQPALGPMFKRIFRPKHKLFKNQPNTNIMLFISVPSPTRPSQKKMKHTRKNYAFVSAGYRISHIPPLVSSIYDQELIPFKKHKVGG